MKRMEARLIARSFLGEEKINGYVVLLLVSLYFSLMYFLSVLPMMKEPMEVSVISLRKLIEQHCNIPVQHFLNKQTVLH